MESSNIPLADALFSKGQQRVLGLLFGHADRSFFANEIIRSLGGGAGGVHRELETLTRAGILSEKRIGNQRHFQANSACPIFEELRGIVRKTFGLGDVLRAALAPLADHVTVAFIYGSIARGEENTASDIDLFVLSNTLAYPDLFGVLSEAEKQLGRPINPSIYKTDELLRKQGEGYAFVNRILDQPRILILGNERDLPEPAQPG